MGPAHSQSAVDQQAGDEAWADELGSGGLWTMRRCAFAQMHQASVLIRLDRYYTLTIEAWRFPIIFVFFTMFGRALILDLDINPSYC